MNMKHNVMKQHETFQAETLFLHLVQYLIHHLETAEHRVYLVIVIHGNHSYNNIIHSQLYS